jgi:hypothetical protein
MLLSIYPLIQKKNINDTLYNAMNQAEAFGCTQRDGDVALSRFDERINGLVGTLKSR